MEKEGREMAGDKGDPPGSWAESRQAEMAAVGVLTRLEIVWVISAHQARWLALVALSQAPAHPLLLSTVLAESSPLLPSMA